MGTRENIFKAVLKVGLKAGVPVLGEVLVAALEETGSLLLDTQADEAARNLNARLVRRMNECAAAHNAPTGDREKAVGDALVGVIGNHAPTALDWPRLGYVPSKCAEVALARGAKALEGLHAGELAWCRIALEGYYEALFAEKDFLLATEADFRSSILRGLSDLPRRLSELSEGEAVRLRSLAVEALLEIPNRPPWRESVSSPGALLRADQPEAVPFHGRDKELADILAWSKHERRALLRVYTGKGGMGKTRLLIEASRALRQAGWRAGFLRSAEAPRDLLTALLRVASPLFVVIDYAETHVELLRGLIQCLFQLGEAGHAVRVVLLARHAGGWWKELKQARDGVGEFVCGPSTETISLLPVAQSLEERRKSYVLAAENFAAILQRPKPADAPPNLDDAMFQQVLLLHMVALLAVDQGVSPLEVGSDERVMEHLLLRERRFWTELAGAEGIPQDLLPGIGQAMAAITLGGGAKDQMEARRVVESMPSFSGQPLAVIETVTRVLHESYPGHQWIEPVLPDLLGEFLVREELRAFPSLGEQVFGPTERA